MKTNIQMRPLVSKGQTATLMLRNGELLLKDELKFCKMQALDKSFRFA